MSILHTFHSPGSLHLSAEMQPYYPVPFLQGVYEFIHCHELSAPIQIELQQRQKADELGPLIFVSVLWYSDVSER